jgi:hypothetical protein
LPLAVVQDAAGNPIDTGNNSASATGVGVTPAVLAPVRAQVFV